MEDRGTLWTLFEPHGTFLNIAETHRTVSDLTELWRLLGGVSEFPEHFWCVLGGETLIFRYIQNIFRNCVNVSSIAQTIGRSLVDTLTDDVCRQIHTLHI